MLYDDLEGWDGVGVGGRLKREEIIVTDVLLYGRNQHNIVKQLSSNINKQKARLPPPTLDTAAAAKSLQSCLTLCYPIDGSRPGSAVPGLLQARTLEGVAISFSNA